MTPIARFERVAAQSSRWIAIVNGYQWGTDDNQFDHALGCSTQTYVSRFEAKAAVRDIYGDDWEEERV